MARNEFLFPDLNGTDIHTKKHRTYILVVENSAIDVWRILCLLCTIAEIIRPMFLRSTDMFPTF